MLIIVSTVFKLFCLHSHDTMASDSTLTVQSLDLSLNELVHWERVALHLPEMSQSTIDKIKRDNSGIDNQKQALYGTWLQSYPGATWGNVIHALETVGENRLAESVRKIDYIRLARNGSPKKLTEKIDESVVTELRRLSKSFESLAEDVESKCANLVTSSEISLTKLARPFCRSQSMRITGARDVNSVCGLFELLSDHYTFLDCSLLEIVVQQLPRPEKNDLLENISDHQKKVNIFKRANTIRSLKDKLKPFVRQAYLNEISLKVVFELEDAWGVIDMKLFETFLETLFPNLSKEINWYKIVSGSLLVTFVTSKNNEESLRSAIEKKHEFILQLGVIFVKLDEATIFKGSKCSTFSFESALHDALLLSNHEAIQFLVSFIGAYIEHEDDIGQTSLMISVACNDSRAVNILLKAKPNPNHSRYDGNTPLHTACSMGSTQLAVMLIEYGANPVITNNKGDTPFLSSIRSHMMEVVFMIAPKVPESQIPPALLLACRLGYPDIIIYLLQYTDPPSSRIHMYCANDDLALVAEHIVEYNEDVNSTLALGITPLMIASSCGHNEIVECLIQANATINSTDKDGYSPLAYAITGKKSLVVVECLLQADADTLVGVNLLQLAAANSDLTDILLQYMALQLYNMFSSVVEKIQRDLSNNIAQQKVTVQELKSRLLNDNEFSQIEGIGKVSSCSELFTCLKPHYHFLSWKVITLLSDFLKQEGYFQHVELFETNLPIDQFPQVVSVVPPFSSVSTCSQLTLSLHREWGIQSMSSLRRLTSLLFSSLARLMSHVTVNVTQQEIFVSYRLPKSVNLPGPIELLSPEILSVLGIIGIGLNNHPISTASEKFNFSFEKAFLNSIDPSFPSSVVIKLMNFLSRLNSTNIDCKDSVGFTPLTCAAYQGYSDVVTFLLSEGADPNITTVEGFTPLLIACVKGYFEIVKFLVQNCPDAVNAVYTSQSISPLQCACVCGHTRVVKYLLQNGADPNILNFKGAFPLLNACLECHVDIAKLLLDAGADSNMISEDGYSTLMIASSRGYSEVIKLILRYDADYRLSRFLNSIPFDSFAFACGSGNFDSVNVFLDTVHLSDRSLSLGWYVSCLLNRPHLIEYLINSLPQVSSANRELVVSCVKGDLAYIKRHLHCPDDVEFVHGVNLLMVACSCGHTSIVKALLEAGASVNRSDEFGYKAVDYCEKHSPILDILNNKEPTKRTFDHEKMFESFGGDIMTKGLSGLSSITDISSELLF